MESLAVWSEHASAPVEAAYTRDMVFWFKWPHLGLWRDRTSFRAYGAAHFWCFLEETTGADFVPALLDRCCQGADWMTALLGELQSRGSTLEQRDRRMA